MKKLLNNLYGVSIIKNGFYRSFFMRYKMIKKIISFIMVILLIFTFIPLSSVYAFSPEDFIGNLEWNKMTDTEKWACVFNFTVAEVGALYNGDASSFISGMTSMQDFMNEHDPDDFVKDNNVVIPENFVSLVKQCLDDYAKENEPYYLAYTLSINDMDTGFGLKKNVYDSLVNLLDESPSGLVAFGFKANSSKFQFTDLGHWFTKISPVRYNDNWVQFYNNETWNDMTMQVHRVELGEDDSPLKSWEEVKQRSYENVQIHNLDYGTCWLFRASKVGIGYKDVSITAFGNASVMPIISKDGRRIRVFNSFGDFQNYTLGKRHVYYTSKYYDYTPAEISVSTKELEQGVKDLNTAMDKLLEQIDKDTPESDIENLLQQILDELRNNGGSGTGSEGPGTDPGTSGGSVDMSTTNSWLAKIYAKVCEIFDKMTQKAAPDQDKDSVSDNSIDLSPTNTILEGIRADINVFMEKLIPGNGQDQDEDSVSGNSVSGNSIDLSHTNSILDSIKACLDDIHETLKKIKRWSVVDTVVGGVDAIADWLDLIQGVLGDVDEGTEEVVSILSSAVDDSLGLMKKKFPFSIPWDILFFISVLSAEPEIPQFSIPFDIEISALDLQFHYDMELDFTPFQWLSDLSRLLLSMTYAVGLMKMTFNVSNMNKEG